MPRYHAGLLSLMDVPINDWPATTENRPPVYMIFAMSSVEPLVTCNVVVWSSTRERKEPSLQPELKGATVGSSVPGYDLMLS